MQRRCDWRSQPLAASLGEQAFGVEGDVVSDKGGDEEVAVVVARLHPELQRLPLALARAFEILRWV